MTGIFDSGIGGLTALAELRRLSPWADICYLADTENAPYGTKSENELTELVGKDIERLKEAGADKILMACCTASTVYDRLTEPQKKTAFPIIRPTARAAARSTKNGKIAVIATERTAASHAFAKEIKGFEKRLSVKEFPMQELVAMTESGIRDSSISGAEREHLKSLLAPLASCGADTLILGCTHFPHLEKEISSILPNMQIISSSREGARELFSVTECSGSGRTIYI